MAYELLAGRPPFVGSSPQQMIAAHITQRPDGLRVHRPSGSSSSEAVVMRCLEKNPADRWQNADDVVRALDAAAAPTSAGARPRWKLIVAGAAAAGGPGAGRGPRRRRAGAGVELGAGGGRPPPSCWPLPACRGLRERDAPGR